MSEETQFWGVAVEGYDKGGHPASALLEGWRLRVPHGRVIPFYPVFDSKKDAEDFVRAAYVRGAGTVIGRPEVNIRQIRRDEIPGNDYVWAARRGLVKWGAL